MSQCKKFAPNIFHKTKCSNCFRQKEEHSAEALECNRASRSVARSGYLFVAPDWDFSVPLNRTKRWQRRWFVLYDDGELNYSVDEHPDTVPQGSVDMSKVLEVTGAEQVTGHPHSLALTSPDRVTFVKAASREDARWWAELLAVFPRRHKRNATFPGGRASPSLPQLGRSASPQPPRPRHLSCNGPSPRANFETPPLKEERESPPKDEPPRPGWLPGPSGSVTIDATPSPTRNDYLMSSGSPPTRDKLRCDDKARARRDWRNERLRDIATALTDRSPESSLALPAESLLHLKKGWLWLKTGDGDFVMRWAVLCGPSLNVYRDQDEQSTPDIVVELSTVTSYSEVHTESKYGFEIKWTGPSLVLCAVTSGIRSNWLQALKKAAPLTTTSAESPSTPRSGVFSSDEEYRTASEGGRRGSEDWSELPPPSPPLTRTSMTRVKDRTRVRPRLPRCQSRQSTLDSTSTDELDCVRLSETVELNNEINRKNAEIADVQKQLAKSVEEVRTLEEEIARLKKFQAEAVIQEKKAKEMMSAFERTERELNQRNSQAELKFTKDQRGLQRRLVEAENLAANVEDKCAALTRELQAKQRLLGNLQEEVSTSNERCARIKEESDRLFKRVQELEGRRGGGIRIESLTDLTNVDLDVDIDELGANELKEYCLDLRGRFEKAVLEIRAVKRELREAHEKCDDLELTNYGFQKDMQLAKQESRTEIDLLVSRMEHLTAKLNAAEKQLRSRAKGDAREKRRSLSLKGRENFSINKEVEDKVTELEAKILALDRGRSRRKYKRERSSERSSPIDDKSLRRLRRKSLDSATSSEPMKLLMRLSTLENQVQNANASTESLNAPPAKTKLDECLNQVAALKSGLKRSPSPTVERLASLEHNLNELNDILDGCGGSVSGAEVTVINASSRAVVKQLQHLLIEKLKSLADRKRALRENGRLDGAAKLQLLAEKVAYENVLIGRIQQALNATGEVLCKRLLDKEARETAHLMHSLRAKLRGEGHEQPPTSKTSAEYLSKVLSMCLIAAAGGRGTVRCLVEARTPTLGHLEEERDKLLDMMRTYKSVKLPQLAEALATETLSIDKTCRLKKLSEDVVNDFGRGVKDTANAELMQAEINHVLLRTAQIYQGHADADHDHFFAFFAAERAALELWSDSVGDRLYDEVNRNITELTGAYQTQLERLQRQNWRRRGAAASTLLQEFADVVAHKALIDARIDVLSGECQIGLQGREDLARRMLDDAHWDCLEDQGVQINQSLEAEFACMVDRCGRECYALIGRPELEEVLGYLNDLAVEVGELQKQTCVPVKYDDVIVKNWSDVCSMCTGLREKLEEVRRSVGRRGHKRFESLEEHRPVYLGTEYLSQVENLRAAYRCAIASCTERHQESDIEQLRVLCERVLLALEQWHRRTIQDMRETHAQEMASLREEKEQALAEETQATLAALDAMRKAHEAEVQREVAKFKQEYARQQRNDIMDLSERLSVKCLEAAALEEQLGSATRQLTHAQQHILHLERNPQLSTMQN